MNNPFEIIEARLSNIELLLLDIKHAPEKKVTTVPDNDFRYIPIQEIFKSKILSKPAFYQAVKAGRIELFKIGNKSYVSREQFDALFQKVNVEPVKRLNKKAQLK